MNRFIGTGRAIKDIELRYTTTEVAVARFTLAVNRDFKNKDGEYESDFISCIAYRSTAELLSKYIKKGDKLGIEGRIQTGSYEKEGQKIYTTDVIVEKIEFMQNKKAEETKAEEPKVESDPFAEFGEQIELDDELAF